MLVASCCYAATKVRLSSHLRYHNADEMAVGRLVSQVYIRLQRPLHTVAASVKYGCSLHYVRLQPPSRTVAGRLRVARSRAH